MQYLGGKHRIARWLASNVLPLRRGRLFEPFHGGLSATVALQPEFASDVFEPVTRLVAALKNGWEPPDFVSEETYHAVRNSGTPLEAFAGFCCSFGGKWYGGYARNAKGDNYAAMGKRSLAKKMQALSKVSFSHRDYFWIEAKTGDTIYCDPPYKGTTGYGTKSFDHELFWDWTRWEAKRGVLVFVSEFTGPDEYLIGTFASKSAMHTSKREKDVIEKLFMVR